ncbi:hypothetical protein BU16DRAFT_521712 [Lophium mytilinum]|uniref:Uncharacterized protein n=1 Tax=Lophium mytilinum TaxID=390894 RepID=A0A6A6RFG1_9PEZI|nr:hypothetical protein BU16DRAFT_521712 [Lophium mytilinum]
MQSTTSLLHFTALSQTAVSGTTGSVLQISGSFNFSIHSRVHWEMPGVQQDPNADWQVGAAQCDSSEPQKP